jgi:hypothetical protein
MPHATMWLHFHYTGGSFVLDAICSVQFTLPVILLATLPVTLPVILPVTLPHLLPNLPT